MPSQITRKCAFTLLAAGVAACGDDATGNNRPASVALVAGDGQVAIGLTALPQSLTVRVNDAGGSPLPGVPVLFQPTGGGSVPQASVDTDAQGEASVEWTVGEPGSPQTLTATVAALTPVTFTATSTVAWVAVGCCEPNAIVTSLDGITWTARPTEFDRAFAVAFNGEQWVVAGQSDVLLATSPDGITWTERDVPIADFAMAVAWDGTQWVAGGCCTGNLATSPDGITWTERETALEYVLGLAGNGSQWVAVGFAPDHSIERSTDGVTWSPVDGGPEGEEAWGVAWNGTLWMATEGLAGRVYTAPDAETWTPQPILGTESAHAASWNGTMWLVSGSSGDVALSADAIDWTTHDTGLQSNYAAAWSGLQWIVVGSPVVSTRIATSPDGMTWTARPNPLLQGLAIAYARPLLPVE
jgi:hypothetical protein